MTTLNHPVPAATVPAVICTIDHSIPGTIPGFLCRGCHPELVTLRSPERPIRSVPINKTKAPVNDDFRSRHPLTEKDKETIAKLAEAENTRLVEVDGQLTEVVVMKRPGIIAVLMEMMRRKEGASRIEMVAELVKRFPERDPKGMASTVSIQSNKLSTDRHDDPKRGRVYRMVVDE